MTLREATRSVIIFLLLTCAFACDAESNEVSLIPNIDDPHGILTATSDDGQHVVFASGRSVNVFDIAAKRIIVRLPTDYTSAVAIAPDTAKVAFGGSRGVVSVYNFESQNTALIQLPFDNDEQTIGALAFSKDGSSLIAELGHVLFQVELKTGSYKRQGPGQFAGFDSLDRLQILRSNASSGVSVYSANSGKKVFSDKTRNSLLISGMTFVTLSDASKAVIVSSPSQLAKEQIEQKITLYSPSMKHSVELGIQANDAMAVDEAHNIGIVFVNRYHKIASSLEWKTYIQKISLVDGSVVQENEIGGSKDFDSSPCGTAISLKAGIVAIATCGGTKKILSSDSFSVVAELGSSTDRIVSARFGDEHTLYLSSRITGLYSFDMNSGRIERRSHFAARYGIVSRAATTGIIAVEANGAIRTVDPSQLRASLPDASDGLATLPQNLGREAIPTYWALSADGRSLYILDDTFTDQPTTIRRVSLQSGKLEAVSDSFLAPIRAVNISPDGATIVIPKSGLLDGYDPSLRRLFSIKTNASYTTTGVEFSGDSSTIVDIARTSDHGLLTFTALKSHSRLASLNIDANSASCGRTCKDLVVADFGGSVSFYRDYAQVPVWSFVAGFGSISKVMISPDSLHVIVIRVDGTLTVLDARTGAPQCSIIIGIDGEWAVVTPKGLFVSSDGGADLVSVVQGTNLISLEEFYVSLNRGDLVSALLRGDPNAMYAHDGADLNLDSVIQSGAPPQIEPMLNSLERLAGGYVRLSVRIVAREGGIGGQTIWRVNGRSEGETKTPPLSPENYVVMSNTFMVDPAAQNTIEIVAQNAKGLRSSAPRRIKIDPFGATLEGGPRLFVLAIGVGPSYLAPEFRLSASESDAVEFAQTIHEASKGLFLEGRIITLTGQDVVEARIAQSFEELRSQVRPSDEFILFLAGHGSSVKGKYYFIPQNFDPSQGDRWEDRWIGQEKWAGWLSQISAEKQLSLFDTCEGEAALGVIRGRAEREAAMDQLRHATGRSIIAAASHEAKESAQLGHGILTYAILEAFRDPLSTDVDQLSLVTVLGLADFVGSEVPKLRRQIFAEEISTINKITNNNFELGYRVPSNRLPGLALIFPTSMSSFVLIRPEAARATADVAGDVNKDLPEWTRLNVLSTVDNSWALVGKDGIKLGYVPLEALRALN